MVRRATAESRSANPAGAWHALDVPGLLAALQSDPRHGLSEREARQRLESHGPNRLARRTGRGPIVRFLLQFHAAVIYILLVATALAALLQHWLDAGVILGVVLVNAVIGYIQEDRALRAIDALARTMSDEARVIRDGRRRQIAATEVVPGDLVILSVGDKVPADVRIVEVHDLHVDESALTGEALPVSKRRAPLPAETPLADRRNMAYSSSLITRGEGLGLVIATGDATEVGRINRLISEATVLTTPLTRKLAGFSRFLMWVILAIAAAMLAIGFLRGMSKVDTILAAVALAVGAIPEGLPAAMTIMLAVGVSRMAARRAIVRKLPAVEALGSTTVICSDKTGTLTENQMTVQHVWAGGADFEVSGVGYGPTGSILRGAEPVDADSLPALAACLRCGLLCNDAELFEGDSGWEVRGDPTEAALIVAARKAGFDPDAEAHHWPRRDVIPFESAEQFMATLHRPVGLAASGGSAPASGSMTPGVGKITSAAGEGLVCVKGSVERLLTLCSTQLDATGAAVPLDASAISARADELAGRGLRVLAFAQRRVPPDCDELTHDLVRGELCFLGLQGMLDPPRPEVIACIRRCHEAGITVKMITGDHAGTAASIAGMIGLRAATGGRDAGDDAGTGTGTDAGTDAGDDAGTGAGGGVLTSSAMAEIADEDLPAAAERTNVFARMTPEQKLRLVRALQARGHIVAMTGDGVNDAPALRQADVGVAMGLTGTEVARQSADIVLTDDNFASIEAAVEEGRAVYDNLTKFIVWTLPTNGGEALLILGSVVAGAQLPLQPVHALYINMTTAVLLGMPLVFEPKETDVMARPPRNPAQPIMTHEVIMRTGLVSLLIMLFAFLLFADADRRGLDHAQAQTLVVTVIVLAELFYLLNCRSLVRPLWSVGFFTNPWLLLGMALMVAVQVAFAQLPLMNRIFGSAPLELGSWLLAAGAGVAVSILIGVEKYLRRRFRGE